MEGSMIYVLYAFVTWAVYLKFRYFMKQAFFLTLWLYLSSTLFSGVVPKPIQEMHKKVQKTLKKL
jgi:hypothetical protein